MNAESSASVSSTPAGSLRHAFPRSERMARWMDGWTERVDAYNHPTRELSSAYKEKKPRKRSVNQSPGMTREGYRDRW